MSKTNTLILIFSVIGILIFGIGMCAFLLPDWNLEQHALIIMAIGIAIIILSVLVKVFTSPKEAGLKIIRRLISCTLFSASILAFGASLAAAITEGCNMLHAVIAGIVSLALTVATAPYAFRK